jgi:hypothetical protein
MAIWDILWSFGIFFPILVCCPKKKSGNHGLAGKLSPFVGVMSVIGF